MPSNSYSRVSASSSLEGMSLEYQLQGTAALREEFDLQPWSWTMGSRGAGRFEDRAVSAWRTDIARRPDGSLMCESIKDGDDVIFYSLCRGFRSVSDWATTLKSWDARGICMHFVKQRLNMRSPLGKFMGNIIASIAQFKCDMASERSRMVKLERRHHSECEYMVTVPRPEIISDKSEPLARIERAFAKLKAERSKTVIRAGRVHRYVRCSAVEQVENGNTLPHQKSKTGAYADRLVQETPGLSMGELFVDEAVSAWRFDMRHRPNGGLMCATIRPGDHVVVSRMDRAFRSVWDFVVQMQAWEEMGVTVHFVDSGICTTDAMGRLMVTVAAALAQYESDMLSAMTIEGIAMAKASGGRVQHNLPRWLTWETRGNARRLTINESHVQEAEEVLSMARELARTGMSQCKVADAIEAHLAARVGRKPIPESGMDYPWSSDFNQGVIRIYKGRKRLIRRWTRDKIWALALEIRIMRADMEVFSDGSPDAALEAAALRLEYDKTGRRGVRSNSKILGD